ncbi:NF-X1-type zinc finger protein NFXL2 [Vitis vinifera]|uniref:NF-X1-type zinc finger protein NFXL2 n=1 Tax=Vitis vinifera TaxID=29760 RepID=A0A438J2I5_VITVI|nr:NF-X1-type zinc finger protein NFXL2 [Vitis vinifera]
MARVVETVSKIVKTGLMMMVAVVAMTMEMVGGIENYDQGGCNGGCCTETYGKCYRWCYCVSGKGGAGGDRGPCAPCPVMVTISCSCGETHFEVPCGTETEQKPPKCSKLCHITPLCKHGSDCKPHRCHYGACPPCRLLCEEEFPCGHKCKLRCHGPKPPPNPEFTLKPKKRKSNHQAEGTPGSPCPPCSELLWRSCVGQHIGTERMERRPKCPHPCPSPCHPGECAPCKVLIKRSCHCGSMVHVFECLYFNSLSEKEQMTIRSCGGPCHRKLPNCTHLCPETCHPGQCPSPDKCSKKVTVRCGCQTLKKEWLCHDVQAAYLNVSCDPKDVSKNQFGLGLLPCNSECKSKVKVVDSELQLRKPKVVERKEPHVEKHVPKRRKRRERVQEVQQISRLQKIISTTWRLLLYFTLLMVLIAVTYYGYKGLLWLSDWMNEVEEKRERRRYPQI